MISSAPTLKRRAVLRGALSSLALAAAPALSAGAAERVAAIDWAMLESALALGVTPVAACELIRFRADAIEPSVPESVTDLGLRGSPNFELLQLTRPTLILTSPWYAQIAPRLEAIAPVLSHAVYTGESPVPLAVSATHALAERLGRETAARAVERDAMQTLEALRARLAPLRDRPVYIVQIGDARHFRAFGPDSMFGNVATLLGLENAWTAPTEFSFAAPTPLERLAARPEARILSVGPIPPEAAPGLRRSVLWNRLAPVAEGRFEVLPPVNPFGAVPAALRFARLAAAALEHMA